jgi:hypothetical protein
MGNAEAFKPVIPAQINVIMRQYSRISISGDPMENFAKTQKIEMRVEQGYLFR